MTTIVNLYGGPGSGKSTTASDLFSLLKKAGINAELVQEYVKQWAWEGRKPVSYDQFYFFGKQSRKEYSLFDKVDVIVTDSPMAINGYYAQHFGSPQQGALFRNMLLEYLRMCEKDGHTHHHVFLTRVKDYNPKGRYQTLEQAMEIDQNLRRYLGETGISFDRIDGDDDAAKTVAELPAIKALIDARRPQIKAAA